MSQAEGFAMSVCLFDTHSKIGLEDGSGPKALMSMKTDSAVKNWELSQSQSELERLLRSFTT